MCVVRLLQKKGNNISFTNSSTRIYDILSRNGFFVSNRLLQETGTVIPLKEFRKEQGIEYSEFTKKHLLRMKIPKMAISLQRKIFEGVDEIFINSTLHSVSDTNIFACGQFYPKLERIDFAIADGGIGMSGAYRLAFDKEMSAVDAIEWAMSGSNTTRQGDIPGGLGLKVLRKFIHLNSGRFIIVSRDGYWKEQGGRVEKRSLKHEFPGTVVTMEINTADTNAYDLVDAPDPRDIW
jgi:hypothetical protein